MFLDLAEPVVSCLDRESTRRIVRLTVPGEVMKKHLAAKWKAEGPDASESDEWSYVFDRMALYFLRSAPAEGACGATATCQLPAGGKIQRSVAVTDACAAARSGGQGT